MFANHPLRRQSDRAPMHGSLNPSDLAAMFACYVMTAFLALSLLFPNQMRELLFALVGRL